jgi:hypothetical protein
VTSTGGAFQPPAPPWVEIETRPDAESYLSVYLSSDLARLPVRDITRLGDNKSDPNLETGTYGLFSTCEAVMRKSIVQRGIGEIFFVTTVEDLGRALVGRYELGWVAHLGDEDAAFAAKRMKFIAPIPVTGIKGYAGDVLREPLRNYKVLEAAVAGALREAIESAKDRTADYLVEIGRLERMSHYRTGFRYPSWDRVEPFNWAAAGPYLQTPSSATSAVGNASPTGIWRCCECQATIRNEARLKVCNVCGKRNTLQPGEASK